MAKFSAAVALLFIFLLGVNGLGDGFRSLGNQVLDAFFATAENPFLALMVGVLATTLVQSSSVTTALVVGLVAAPENPLPIASAVPMIMVANIGTTVTNTIVSLGHVTRPEEFRRAFAVATCHDFFNYITVLVLFPLEMATGYLQKSATAVSGLVTGFGGAEYDSPIRGAIKAGTAPIKDTIAALVDGSQLQAVGLILVSVVLIFGALYYLVKVMRSAMRSRVEAVVSRTLGANVWLAITVGIVATVMVQSSSITTALLVPLAGAGILTLPQAFPITIGANIGTTVTAFLAALAVTGDNAQAGVTIAIVHLFFNLSGTLLIYPWQVTRQLPLRAATWLADVATRSRRWALVYVVTLFYLLPGVFALLNRAFFG